MKWKQVKYQQPIMPNQFRDDWTIDRTVCMRGHFSLGSFSPGAFSPTTNKEHAFMVLQKCLEYTSSVTIEKVEDDGGKLIWHNMYWDGRTVQSTDLLEAICLYAKQLFS